MTLALLVFTVQRTGKGAGGHALETDMTCTHIREIIRVLDDDIRDLCTRLDAVEPDTLEAESIERILGVKEALRAEQQEKLERIQSAAARIGAEARLAYHVENDTLDLY